MSDPTHQRREQETKEDPRVIGFPGVGHVDLPRKTATGDTSTMKSAMRCLMGLVMIGLGFVLIPAFSQSPVYALACGWAFGLGGMMALGKFPIFAEEMRHQPLGSVSLRLSAGYATSTTVHHNERDGNRTKRGDERSDQSRHHGP